MVAVPVVGGTSSGDEHRIAITLDPARIVPHEKRRVVIKTDDPLNPRIEIPITIPED